MLGIFWGGRSDRMDKRDRFGRRGRTAHRDHRPALEGLEERIVLSTEVWSGAASTAWTNPANWVGSVAPVTGDDLVFPTTGSTTSNNDFPAGTAFHSITIQGAGYDITGNAIGLSAGITASYTAGTSTYEIPTSLTAVVAPIAVAGGGTLDLTSGAILSGNAGLNVTGGGVLNTAAANTYLGATTIGSNTTLVVDGTVAGGVQNSGGGLLGNGSVSNGVNSVGGTIFAGNPAVAPSTTPAPGQITVTGALTLDSASTLAALLDGDTPGDGQSGYSQISVTSGAVTLGGAKLSIGLGTGFSNPQQGTRFTIIKNGTGTAINGNFANLAEGGAITVGNSLFRISYLGTDGNGSDVVLTAVTTTSSTTLLPVQLPTSANQQITLTAQVTGALGKPLDGRVLFYNGNPTAGGALLGQGNLTELNSTTSTATLLLSSLGTGSSTAIYAVYVPDPADIVYAGSTSAPITFGTTTTVTSSSPVGLVGQPITFTATVLPSSAGAGTPTGSVQFVADKTTVLGTVAINPATGQASITTSSLGIGTHSIVATFIPNAPFNSSASSAFSQSISTAGVVPELSIVPVLNRRGKVVRYNLVVQVQPLLSVGVAPTGTVTYFINGRAFYRTVPLSDGMAVLARPGSRLINQYIFVRFNGDATFVASASSSMYISNRQLALIKRQAESAAHRRSARIRA